MFRILANNSRRFVQRQVRNHGHDHHAPANPGPPCTYDMMPIPSQPYAKVHAELQTKFNTYLGVSLVLLVSSLASAVYTNLWIYEELQPPRSWRERK